MVVYAYAVVRGLDDAELSTIRGVGGTAVRCIGDQELAAVVSSVSTEEFGEEGLRANLERLEWLEPVARAHHGVVEAVLARATTLPLRLATVYHSDARVVEVLRSDRSRLQTALDRLSGRVEIGVKIYLAQASGLPRSTVDSGREYLRHRRDALRSRDTMWAAAATAARAVDAELTALAADRRHHRPQSGGLVLNAAYLVDDDVVADFRTRVACLARDARPVLIEATGPWPAYSFATADPTEVSA